MTTLNDFLKTDLLHDHHADHVNILQAAALRAEFANTETISALKELNDGDTPFQSLTASGGNQNVELPPEATSNHVTVIYNAGGSNNLLVYDDSGSTLFGTLAPGGYAVCYPIAGVLWKASIYTPAVSFTLTAAGGFTIGNGTVVSRYVQIGKLVKVQVTLVWGSTTAISGNVFFDLPVTPLSVSIATPVGFLRMTDVSVPTTYQGVTQQTTSGTLQLIVLNASGTYATASQLSSTAPFTWVSTDELEFEATYIAA